MSKTLQLRSLISEMFFYVTLGMIVRGRQKTSMTCSKHVVFAFGLARKT
jgi:hypothetical protein